MAYGRLDIFWPDGRIESYPLESPSVSVGRSSGCAIVLDTDTISRYHLSITNDAGTVNVADLDSANGTYIDGVLLKQNQSYQLLGGEELQIGHIRMIYHVVEEVPTLMMDEIAEDTQRFERAGVGFTVEITGPEIAVPPGAHTSIEVAVTNITAEAQLCTIQIDGLPEGWARINRPEVDIEPDNTALILITIKPLRMSTSKPGQYQTKITVAQYVDIDKRIEAIVPVKILAYGGFGMALANDDVSGKAPFQLHILNQGNADLPIHISGRSQDNDLQFHIREPQMTLVPGERRQVTGKIVPIKRRMFGNPRVYPFDLMVRSRDEAAFLAAVRGHFTDSAIVPLWLTYMLGLVSMITAILLLMMVFALFNPTTETPHIIDFQVDSGKIAQGDPLQLSWFVEDTESVRVLINDVVVAEESAAIYSASIETDNYDGIIFIRMEAVNGDKMVVSSLSVEVYQQPRIIAFQVEPQEVIKGDLLLVSWQTEKADSIIVFVDDIVVAEVDAETTSMDVHTGAYGGVVSVRLEAVNEDSSVSAVVQADVYMLEFSVEPLMVFRNIEQSLTLTWRAIGVDNARILGLEGSIASGAEEIMMEYPSEGELEVMLMPIDNFTVFLSIESVLGEIFEQAVHIDVLDPSCLIKDIGVDAMRAYIEGDGGIFRLVEDSTFIGETISVDGRSEDIRWIHGRHQITGGANLWWAADSLTCGEEFSLENLRIALSEPPEIIHFEVAPPTLFRNMEQPLMLSWHVNNAQDIRILGLEGVVAPGGEGIDPNYPPVNDLDIMIITDADFVVSLFAENIAGEIYEQLVPVEVLDPICTITEMALDVFPMKLEFGDFRPIDDFDDLVSEMVVVDGRNDDSSWIRGYLQNEENMTVWWPAEGLDCDEGVFADRLRLVPFVVRVQPIPTATSLPTMTPMPTATLLPTVTPTPTASPLPTKQPKPDETLPVTETSQSQ